MFFIVNKTKNNISIGDLRITLGPRQAMDLDKTIGREKSEYSKDLKTSVRSGTVEIKRKDDISKYKIKEEVEQPNINSIKDELLAEMRETLKEVGREIKEGMNKPYEGISKEDLTSVMKEVISQMPQASNTVIMREVNKNLASDYDVQLDEALLADIHARAVNDLTKDSKTTRVNYRNEKVQDTLDNNVSELENLLG